jgi:hypothetical protein
VLLAVSLSGSSGDQPPAAESRTPKRGQDRDKERASDVKTEAAAAQKKGEKTNAIDDLLKAEKELQEKKELMQQEDERRKQVPGRMIQAKREECRGLEEKKDFQASVTRWNEFLDQAKAGELKDEKNLKAEFQEEHFSEIGKEISEVGRRWEKSVGEDAARIIDRSGALCQEARSLAEALKLPEMKAKFEEARKVLTVYPAEWEGRFADQVQRLVQAKNDIDYAERQTEKQIVAAQTAKAQRTIETGRWVDLLTGEADFLANWHGQIEKYKWDKEEKTMTIEGPPNSLIVPNFTNEKPGSASWADYELEFEMKSSAPLAIFMRYKQNAKRISIQIPVSPQFQKFLAKVEGVALYLYVGGEVKAQGIVDLQAGPPLFIISGVQGSTTFKNMKIKVNKTSN